MDKPKKTWVIISFICMMLGFMLAVLYVSNDPNDQGETRGLNDLRIELQKERERTNMLLAEIRKHNELLNRYESSTGQDSDPVEVMEKEKERLKSMIGLEEMEGKGFIIRLIPRLFPNQSPTDTTVVIYDEDLRLIVNELNAYGAKAIAINGQRVIVTTAIRNVENRILVNTRPISPPYEISVIGDPSMLIPALKLAGLEEYFKVINYNIVFEEKQKLVVPAYQQKINLRYLKPFKEEDR
jgi:uncharacterized protein YlxW (UPF0749 family)